MKTKHKTTNPSELSDFLKTLEGQFPLLLIGWLRGTLEVRPRESVAKCVEDFRDFCLKKTSHPAA